MFWHDLKTFAKACVLFVAYIAVVFGIIYAFSPELCSNPKITMVDGYVCK